MCTVIFILAVTMIHLSTPPSPRLKSSFREGWRALFGDLPEIEELHNTKEIQNATYKLYKAKQGLESQGNRFNLPFRRIFAK